MFPLPGSGPTTATGFVTDAWRATGVGPGDAEANASSVLPAPAVPVPTQTPSPTPTASATPVTPTAAPPVQPPPAPGADSATVDGQVYLQGRSDHGGADVLLDGMPVAKTDRDGSFSFHAPAGQHTLTVRHACYLDREMELGLTPNARLSLDRGSLSGGDEGIPELPASPWRVAVHRLVGARGHVDPAG